MAVAGARGLFVWGRLEEVVGLEGGYEGLLLVLADVVEERRVRNGERSKASVVAVAGELLPLLLVATAAVVVAEAEAAAIAPLVPVLVAVAVAVAVAVGVAVVKSLSLPEALL
jgi:hypothetical protein